MRYNKPVYFQKLVKGKYNSDTGNYENDYIDETLQFSSIMDTKTENQKMLYGKPKQGSYTISLHNPYLSDYDSIRIKNRSYQVDYARNNKIFMVSEMAGGK